MEGRGGADGGVGGRRLASPPTALNTPSLPAHAAPVYCAVYFPGLEAYFKLTEDLGSNTRLRWGAACVHQHPADGGWRHVFWDMDAARELVLVHYPQVGGRGCGGAAVATAAPRAACCEPPRWPPHASCSQVKSPPSPPPTPITAAVCRHVHRHEQHHQPGQYGAPAPAPPLPLECARPHAAVPAVPSVPAVPAAAGWGAACRQRRGWGGAADV